MSKTRTWTLGGIALMLVVVIGGYMLGISPIFSQISAAQSQTTTIQSTNATTQAQLASLKTQYAGISTLQGNLDALRLSIPEAAAASAFINELTALSAVSGVGLQSVAISDATLYTAPTATTPVAGSTATATPAPTTTTTTTTPTVTSNGLVIIPVVIEVQAPLGNAQEFVQLLQTGARLFVSSNLTLSTSASDGTVTADITGDIFTLQGSSDSATGANTPKSDSTPTPYATVTPTATPTPTGTASTSSTSKTGSTSPKTVTPPAPTSTPEPSSSDPTSVDGSS